MIIFALQPIIDLIVEHLILKCTRRYYRSKYYNKKLKECSKDHSDIDQHEFIYLYAGPEYCFYYKGANAVIMVFIAVIFGPIFPILYFISFCSLGV